MDPSEVEQIHQNLLVILLERGGSVRHPTDGVEFGVPSASVRDAF